MLIGQDRRMDFTLSFFSKKTKCCSAITIVCLINILILFNPACRHLKCSIEEKLNIYEDISNPIKQETNGFIEIQSGRLPDWKKRGRLNIAEMSSTKFTAFRQVLTQVEYEILMGLLRKLKHLCNENSLTYMLYGGAVIGAYRHAGFVPWDDDIDVWLDLRQMEKARNILNNSAGIILYQSDEMNNMWKMSNVSKTLNKTRVNQDPRFPYIDVFFFTGNATHVYDLEDQFKENTTLLIDDVFPLRKALFEDEEFFVPNKMLTSIERMYGRPDICTSRSFGHEFHIKIKIITSIPCDQLYSYYPFVIRSYNNNTLTETLVFLEQTIRKTIAYVRIM